MGVGCFRLGESEGPAHFVLLQRQRQRGADPVVTHTHSHHHFFEDCTLPEFINGAPSVDVFFAGFPCQPYSAAGSLLGLDDHRSLPLYAILHYVVKRLPGIALLENVLGLLRFHKPVLESILLVLSGLKDSAGQPAHHGNNGAISRLRSSFKT